jgi:hypothetical protein
MVAFPIFRKTTVLLYLNLFFQGLLDTKQIRVPKAAIKIQILTVLPQPKLSEIIAMP